MDKPIYDQNNNLLSEDEIDLKKGYLLEDGMEFEVPATEGIPEEGHYEYKEYPNGGRDRWWVVDVPGVAAQEAHTEMRPIYRYFLNPEPEDFEDILETPSQLDRIEAQTLYTAIMTDTLLETENAEPMPDVDGAELSTDSMGNEPALTEEATTENMEA